eukprot:6995254-Pyramimonas_sp.AAC.1
MARELILLTISAHCSANGCIPVQRVRWQLTRCARCAWALSSGARRPLCGAQCYRTLGHYQGGVEAVVDQAAQFLAADLHRWQDMAAVP